MKEDLVLLCNLHEVVVQTLVNKGITLDSTDHTLHVEVRFSHLEGTLIPFGNEGQHCQNQRCGWKYVQLPL